MFVLMDKEREVADAPARSRCRGWRNPPCGLKMWCLPMTLRGPLKA